MRNLTSIQGKYTVPTNINVHVTASDQSTTWTFSLDHIISMSAISWEGKIGGGISVPSTYTITLSTSLDFIKTYRNQINQAEVNLKVIAGTDAFYPHKGIVRGVSRNNNDPHSMNLTIYDRFLDSNPRFPVASIVDSYTTAHPETFNDDLGYPAYYGSHLRPFYFYAVDCNLSAMIGPSNVSSENHVNSVFYSTDKALSRDPGQQSNLLMNGTWSQVDCGNIFNLTNPFEVQGLGPNDNRLFTFGPKNMTSKEIYALVQHSDIESNSYVYGSDGTLLAGLESSRFVSSNRSYFMGTDIVPRFEKSIQQTNYIRLSAVHSVTNVGVANVRYRILANSGNVFSSIINVSSQIGTDSGVFTFVQTADSSETPGIKPFLTKNFNFYYFTDYTQGFTQQSSIQPTLTISLDCKCTFFSNKFTNYSVYATPVNTSDISVSQNPFGILRDIFDNSSISYVSAQNSVAQSNVTSYQLNCLFDKRLNVSQISHEFGQITKTNMWVADSGMINFRTYQNSANAIVDHTIITSDMLDFSILESPLGSTIYQSTKYKKVKLGYNYDYSKKNYEESLQANPANNSFCSSVSASGIENELSIQNKYIIATDTASYYLGNIVSFNTQENEYVEIVLPPRYYELELFDVVRVKHPMIVGSESTYQVIAISHNYTSGTVFIRAQELLRIL